MTPNEIYALPVDPRDLDPYELYAVSEMFFNLLGGLDTLPEGANQRVRLIRHVERSSDGYRNWMLASLWLDDRPFAVVQRAGRGGQDWTREIVTDPGTWGEAMLYLVSLRLQHERGKFDQCGPDDDRPDLTTFYSESL